MSDAGDEIQVDAPAEGECRGIRYVGGSHREIGEVPVYPGGVDN